MCLPISGYAAKRGIDVQVVSDVAEAVGRAWTTTNAAGTDGDDEPSSDAVIVTGSLYTVGAARQACRRLGLFES